MSGQAGARRGLRCAAPARDSLEPRCFSASTAPRSGQRHRARFFGRNLDVPVMIIAVGTGGQVAAAVPELESLLRRPLMTVERVQLCKRDGELVARPEALPSTDDSGRPLWQKLMIHTSEATLHDGVPIHRAIVRRLRESRAAERRYRAARHLGIPRRP